MRKLFGLAAAFVSIASHQALAATVSMPTVSTSNTDPMEKWATIRDYILNAGTEIGFGMVVMTGIIILIRSLRGNGFNPEAAGKTAMIGVGLSSIPFIAGLVFGN